MLQKIKAITIYAAASSRISSVYFEAAKNLGKQLADHSITCINGGGIKGLMAAVTDAVLENGGNVCGVIPQFMYNKGWIHPAIPEVIVTPDMHVRKRTMADKSDACIALPGGVGTLEELLEIITWKQLGLYSKPIVILNTADYYNPLLTMLDKADRENFIHSKSVAAWQVATTPEEALDFIFNKH
ncbi:MAG: TIGR00730 family Rossman fold protein [Candidatus Azobacteroides sp.]|nr:TIGR00730 family Rossman fold protein [Candidatus Azobacteroides sp.]